MEDNFEVRVWEWVEQPYGSSDFQWEVYGTGNNFDEAMKIIKQLTDDNKKQIILHWK